MNAFPNPALLKQWRVSKRAAEIGSGNGPQKMNEKLTGCLKIYTHHAISGGKTVLVDGNSFEAGHWIWNEEIFADIPTAYGKRIIFPGPASNLRMLG